MRIKYVTFEKIAFDDRTTISAGIKDSLDFTAIPEEAYQKDFNTCFLCPHYERGKGFYISSSDGSEFLIPENVSDKKNLMIIQNDSFTEAVYCQTNYERIKEYSLDEMAENLVRVVFEIDAETDNEVIAYQTSDGNTFEDVCKAIEYETEFLKRSSLVIETPDCF